MPIYIVSVHVANEHDTYMYYYMNLQFCFPTGALKSPVLTYKNTLGDILVSWSPVSSDGVCGPVSYRVAVKPSHGMVKRVNDTAYNITGLNYNTDYTITVYATNGFDKVESAPVTVRIPAGTYVKYIYTYINN